MRLVLLALCSLLAVAWADDYYMCPRYVQRDWGEVHYVKHWASESFFKLPCPAGDRDMCNWFHEEWSIPRYYMKFTEIDEMGSLRMKAMTDNSGTWRVKYGEFETVYHVTIIPKDFKKFVVDGCNFYGCHIENRRFERQYFYNGFMRDSYFKDVTFRNMYFHYVRFENVTFENVRFDWTEDMYMRAEFVNCHFINTMFSGARFSHSFFHYCRFEGGMMYSDDQMHEDQPYTFFDFYMYDTFFSHVEWYDTYWYRGEAYNTTFMYNRWTKFEMFETKFHSYYSTKVPCREVMYGDFVYHWEYFDENHCYAYVYRYAMDKYFDFDDKFYHGVGNDSWWYPSMKFYNCWFEYFTFRRTQMRAVEWMYTNFYNGTFYGDNYGYFYDHHFTRCRFRDTDFYRFYFRGFTYFTACYFDTFKFSEMTGDRMYFYGSYYYHFYMHFTMCRFMYFDYGHWEHGYMMGSYDFFRFENMMFKYCDWKVDRVDMFEYCHVYYEYFKIATPNVGEFKSICGDKYYHEKMYMMQFCYDYPYYYQCMHYRPFYRHYYTYDEFTCDTKTFTWWWYWGWYFPKDYDRYHYDMKPYCYDKTNCNDGAYYYDRSYFYDSSFNYDRPYYNEMFDHYRMRDMSYYSQSYDKFYYPTFDFFSLKHCYHKMYERYDQPAVMMREVDFKQPGEFFFGMPSTYTFYYDGMYQPYYYWKYYWMMGHAFEKKYYWFESYFHCFK